MWNSTNWYHQWLRWSFKWFGSNWCNFSGYVKSLWHCATKEIICCKLFHYSIHGYTFKWIESLLTGRSQQVVVNDEYMQWSNYTVISEVSQGSVLGPLLFLCYINDITESLTSKVRMYMLMIHCTLIYRKILEQDVVALQNDLNSILKWSINWQV